MATPKGKDWQAAMDKISEQMKTMFDGLSDKLNKLSNDNDEIKKMNDDIKKEIGEIKKELHSSNKKMEELEEKTSKIDAKMTELEHANKKINDHMTLMDCRVTENHLRLRGIPEDFKSTREDVIKLLAGYLEEDEEEISYNFDIIYRVNSVYAQQKNLPRDIIVQLLTKSMREGILKKQFKKPLMIDDKKIIIMKELPRKVLQSRKNYRKLTEKLRTKNIRYRWELPEGLTFEYQGKRNVIKSIDHMQVFLFENAKDFGLE